MKYYCENCGSEFEVVEKWQYDHCPICRCNDLCIKAIPAHETVAQWEARRGRKYPQDRSGVCKAVWG
jgi:predicted  nucleic acid-binding Zn-ribbon protein